MIEALQADNLKELAGVRHGFFTRKVDRAGVAESLGVKPERLFTCRQIHSAKVVVVDELWRELPEADAMVTKEKGVALGILTADCVPVLFADAGAGVIGAAHAGWRGAISGVLENTVKAMEELGALRKNIRGAIGPCIWQNSYEVGPEFPAPFLAEDGANEKYFRAAFKSDRYMFDLAGYVLGKLKALELRDVEPSVSDTFADEEFFYSYRRDTLRGEKQSGRLISGIMLGN